MQDIKENVIEALKTVEDPELFLDIYFLGLIYEIDIADELVNITMTFTSPMCPAGPYLVDQVTSKVGEVEGVSEVKVEVTFDPPWTPSDEVKGMMGFM